MQSLDNREKSLSKSSSFLNKYARKLASEVLAGKRAYSSSGRVQISPNYSSPMKSLKVHNEASILHHSEHLIPGHSDQRPASGGCSENLRILDSGRVQLSPKFAGWSKRAKVNSFIMYPHSVVGYDAATELVNPGGRSREGCTNAAGLMGG